MVPKHVQCFAHGRGNDWQAICVDFDIAVQGHSLPDVQQRLGDAVTAYVIAAMEQDEDTRREWLSRRVPLSVELGLFFGYFAHVLTRRRRRDHDECKAGFDVCPALG